MPKGSSWNSGGGLSLNRYRGLDFRKSYLQIHDFLRDEGLARKGFERLERDTQGMNPTRFQGYLAKEERRFGFTSNPGIIPPDQSLLKASRFWGYLMRGEPLIDIGAGDKSGHGVLTHRVQWVLVGQWNETLDPSRRLEASIPSLYRNLAAGNARVLSTQGQELLKAGGQIDTGQGKFFDSVWDDVFDTFDDNATNPEQVFGYTQIHYPSLHDRMLWQDAGSGGAGGGADAASPSPEPDSTD